jgi:hypothetical protein
MPMPVVTAMIPDQNRALRARARRTRRVRPSLAVPALSMVPTTSLMSAWPFPNLLAGRGTPPPRAAKLRHGRHSAAPSPSVSASSSMPRLRPVV